jgi:phosphotransferase system HPr (HPr) family protein
MVTVTAIVLQETGLHARPAADFVSAANQYDAVIQVRNLTTGSDWVDAKSILSLLLLGAEKGHQIEITAAGSDAEPAVQALLQIV